MPHVEPLRAGDPATVGPYRLAGRLGAGGRGVVYLGRTRTGALVAVKVLHDGLVAGDRLAAAVAAARTVEPYGVARVLDASTEARPYIVSEYVDGPSLRQSGRLTGEDLRHLAVATATALTAIHRAGMVHGSLTPTNVLLAKDGPRLTDFTLPHFLTPPHALGRLAGTLAYAAPEQVAGQAVGAAADVFSWGAVLVFAATGTPPFGDDAPSAVIHRVLHEEPRLGDLPRALREVVAACLAKDPPARPGMREVVLRLTASTRRPTAPPAAPDWERTPDRAWDAPALHPAPPAQTHASTPPAQGQAGPSALAHAAAQETEDWDVPVQDLARPAKTGEHPVFPPPNASRFEAVRTPPPLTHHHTSSAPAAWPHHDGTNAMSAGPFSPAGPAVYGDGPPASTGPAPTSPRHDGTSGVRAGGPSAFAAGQDGPGAFATGWENGRATGAGGGSLRTGESRGEHPAVPASGQGGGDGPSGEGGGGGAALRAGEGHGGHPAVPVAGGSGGDGPRGGRTRRAMTVVVAVLAGVVVVVLGGAIWWLTPATPGTAPSTAPSTEPSSESSGGDSTRPSIRPSIRPSTGRSAGASDSGTGESSVGRGTASSTAGGGELAVVHLRPEGVRDGGCWSGGEVTLRALVRRTGGATAFRYTWVVDGAPAGRSSALVAENGRRYLTAPQTLRGAGGTHDVSLRITAPVAVQRTITVTMCAS